MTQPKPTQKPIRLWVGSLHPEFSKAAVFTSVEEYKKYGWNENDIVPVIEHSAYQSLEQRAQKLEELVKEAESLLVGVATQKNIPLAKFHLWMKALAQWRGK